MVADRSFKHGFSDSARDERSPEYTAWKNAKARCSNPKSARWNHYGGRGIRMCDEWLNSFEEFLSHVGERPSKKHSIDRYPDNDGNYEPGNVRWATPEEQARNRSITRNLTIGGYTMCLAEAAKKFGLNRKKISRRLDRNWSDEEAVGLK